MSTEPTQKTEPAKTEMPAKAPASTFGKDSEAGKYGSNRDHVGTDSSKSKESTAPVKTNEPLKAAPTKI